MTILRRFWYFFLLIFILFVWLLYSTLNQKLPIVSSTTPADQAQNVSLLSNLIVNFSQGPDNAPITLSTTPSFDTRLVEVKSNSLVFTPTTPLRPNTTYSVSILSKNQELSRFQFTTVNSQTDQTLIDELHAEIKDKYPLAANTPYTTSEYRVIYSAPLTLQITLKNQSLTSAQAITQVKAWVESQGIPSSSHQYTVK